MFIFLKSLNDIGKHIQLALKTGEKKKSTKFSVFDNVMFNVPLLTAFSFNLCLGLFFAPILLCAKGST